VQGGGRGGEKGTMGEGGREEEGSKDHTRELERQDEY
jgi:hypothetical protein